MKIDSYESNQYCFFLFIDISGLRNCARSVVEDVADAVAEPVAEAEDEDGPLEDEELLCSG